MKVVCGPHLENPQWKMYQGQPRSRPEKWPCLFTYWSRSHLCQCHQACAGIFSVPVPALRCHPADPAWRAMREWHLLGVRNLRSGSFPTSSAGSSAWRCEGGPSSDSPAEVSWDLKALLAGSEPDSADLASCLEAASPAGPGLRGLRRTRSSFSCL